MQQAECQAQPQQQLQQVVDPSLLRRALRLVHCIQKERGASCAYVASNGQQFIKFELELAQKASDNAVRLMKHTDLPVGNNLNKIRKLVQTSPLTTLTTTVATGTAEPTKDGHSNNTNGLVFHRIFICFNTLISSVVHESILKYNISDLLLKDRGTTIKKHHSRCLSVDINEKLISDWRIYAPESPIASNHNLLLHHHQQQQSPTKHVPAAASLPQTIADAIPPTVVEDETVTDIELPEESPSKEVRFSINDDDHSKTQSSKVSQVLNLLHCFVRLKESTGVERAVLSSILAFGPLAPESTRLITDLILEVENQRSILAELGQLESGHLRNLALELAQLSPLLLDLQHKILGDFNVLAEEYGTNKIWDTLTTYMDKLHSLELLMIEELECELPLEVHPKEQAICDIFGPDIQVTDLEAMTAEQVKATLLQSLSPDRIVIKSPSPSPSPSPSRNSSSGSNGKNTSSGDQSFSSIEKIHGQLLAPLQRAAVKEWEISLYEIKFQRRIGQGASGTTYLASWSGQTVAVKVASITTFGLDGWRTEVQALQKLHHPNVIRLLGSVYHQNPLTFCLVLEYCNGGDLATALRYPTPRNFFFHVSTSVATAMTYLHNRGIVHRDLKPGNVLIDGNIASGKYTLKVTDFGVATEVDEGAATRGDNLTGETGTYRWMSPEVIRHEKYSSKADVYSFAIILWQLLSREDPFADISQVEAAGRVAVEQARPPLPPKTPSEISKIIIACWDDDPSKRWEFKKLADQLQKVRDDLTNEQIVWVEDPEGHPVYEKRKEEAPKKVVAPSKTPHNKQQQHQDHHGGKRGGFLGFLGKNKGK